MECERKSFGEKKRIVGVDKLVEFIPFDMSSHRYARDVQQATR